MRIERRRYRHAISPIFGVLLLVAMPILAATVLYAFKSPVPQAQSTLLHRAGRRHGADVG
jgi:flagellin-like protein